MKTKEELNAKMMKLDDASLDTVTGGVDPFTPNEPEGKNTNNPFVLNNTDDLSILAGVASPDPDPSDYGPSPITYTYPIV